MFNGSEMIFQRKHFVVFQVRAMWLMANFEIAFEQSVSLMYQREKYQMAHSFFLPFVSQ